MAVDKVRRLSIRVRNLVLQYATMLLSTVKIQALLEDKHGVSTSRQAVRKFLNRYHTTGSIIDPPRKQKTITRTRFMKDMVNLWMTQNGETTARVLRDKVRQLFGANISLACISKLRRQLGWMCKRVKYCQLISHQNRQKRLKWSLSALERKDDFKDVVFTDESTIEMSSSGKLFFYQPTSMLQHLPAKKQKPKHAYKVHIWGGISYRGRTDCCVFTGIMDSITYQQILERNFLPWVGEIYPDGYRLYQDNDSKHKSKSTVAWMEEKGMIDSVMECPPSSPDINVIENVWASLKYFLEGTVKPKTKDQLVEGIKLFWSSLTVEQCGRNIDYIHRVLPVVVLNDGAPSGF